MYIHENIDLKFSYESFGFGSKVILPLWNELESIPFSSSEEFVNDWCSFSKHLVRLNDFLCTSVFKFH